jgi:hypothetical protein
MSNRKEEFLNACTVKCLRLVLKGCGLRKKMNSSNFSKGVALMSAMTLASSMGGLADANEFVTKRHVYIRGEKATLQVALKGGADAVAFDVSGRFAQTSTPQVGSAVPGGMEASLASYSFDTSLLRSGDYEVRAQPMQGGRPLGEAKNFVLTIAPAPNPQRYPLWHWGTANQHNFAWWKARGFNGFRQPEITSPTLVTGPPFDSVQDLERSLEESARMGFNVGAMITPIKAPELKSAASEGRSTKLYPRNPVVIDHARRTAESIINRFGDYPAFKHSMLSTEYQVPPLSSKIWESFVKEESGLKLEEMPQQEWFPNEKNVYLDVSKLPANLKPENGIIEDDNAAYRYLQWWWQRGHGTSLMNEEMAKALKSRRPDVITWHDPYRLAPVRNSHSGLDMVSTWTYGHPDIKRLAYTTVLQAAARPNGQKVMQTITLWIYARYVVPLKSSTADLQNDFAGEDESFVQGPDYAREAMWLVVSQRPDVLGFFNTYVKNPDITHLDPSNTSPTTWDAIGEVSRALIEPYGPSILNSQRERPRTAVLMSASALWFNGSRGWINEEIMPFISLLMMNHIPFEIVLDDDIMEGRLNQYDALIIPRGEVLLRGVHQRISDFARAGKKVITDRSVAAKIPGAQKTNFDFSFQKLVDGTALGQGTAITADDYKTRMEKFADELKPLVAGLQGVATAGSKRVVMNSLQSGDIQYVFAINDDKTYGPRFGQHKLFQELGVVQKADLQIAGAASKTLYDALERRELKFTSQNGGASFQTTLPAAQGKLIAVLPEKIGKIELKLPAQAERGREINLQARVLGVSGMPIKGSLPLRIEVLDATGRSTEYTRFAATATDGTGFTLQIIPALNDQAGRWTIRVTDWLSNTSAEQEMAVN